MELESISYIKPYCSCKESEYSLTALKSKN